MSLNKSLKKPRGSKYTKLDKKGSPIQKLDDDSLRNIFNYLPIKDKVKIERVCFRWLEVIKDTWRSYKKLDFSKEIWGCYIFGPGQIITEKNHHILSKVLSRCGPYLKNIKLIFDDSDFEFKNINEKNFVLLGTLCPNLEVINLIAPNSAVIFLLQNLSENCNNNINELIINETSLKYNKPINEHLNSLFLRNNKIKVLELTKACVYEDLPLLLPDSLEAFQLRRIRFTDFLIQASSLFLINIIEHLKNLKVLRIEFTEEGWRGIKNIFNTILQIGNNLTDLSLYLDEESSESYENELSQLFSITKLKNLKLKYSLITGKCFLSLKAEFIESIKLTNCPNISESYLNYALENFNNLITFKIKNPVDPLYEYPKFDNVNNKELKNVCLEENQLVEDSKLSICLSEISELSNLQILNLSYTISLKDNFLNSISQRLNELIILRIDWNSNITDHGLNAISKLPKLQHLSIIGLEKITGKDFVMPNLITLNCSGCYNINPYYLYKIVIECSKLQFLDISYCKNIKNDFLNAINNEFEKKEKKKIFSIYYLRSGIDFETDEEKALLKNLDFVNSKYYTGVCRSKPFKYLQLID